MLTFWVGISLCPPRLWTLANFNLTLLFQRHRQPGGNGVKRKTWISSWEHKAFPSFPLLFRSISGSCAVLWPTDIQLFSRRSGCRAEEGEMENVDFRWQVLDNMTTLQGKQAMFLLAKWVCWVSESSEVRCSYVTFDYAVCYINSVGSVVTSAGPFQLSVKRDESVNRYVAPLWFVERWTD